jgi:undecaprenyl-diphosphatase
MHTCDLAISSFINGFAHRSVRFDELVIFVSRSNLLKGGVVIGLIWWLWFRNGDDRTKREALLASILASFPALAVARILSWIFFRPRPLNDPQFPLRLPYGISAAQWEGISSFPSDHAVLFFALATGILFASRRAGWFAFVYISVAICMPRLFIGEHYTTDILAGAAIGISMTWLANLPPIRKVPMRWAWQWLDARPGQFYCFLFILTYQMAELYNPILNLINFIIHGKLPS